MVITIKGKKTGKVLADYFNNGSYSFLEEWKYDYSDNMSKIIDEIAEKAINNNLDVKLYDDNNNKVFDSEAEKYL